MKKSLLLLPMLFFLALSAWGQEDTVSTETHQFSVGAQLWSRGEVRYGALPAAQKVKDGNFATFLMSNVVLNLSYQFKGLEVKLSPRVSGIWGAQSSGGFDLDEGWMALRHRNGLFVQAGRVALAYDDERIIGSNDWEVAASRQDLLRAGYEGKHHKVHVLAVFNQTGKNTNGGTYYTDGSQPHKSMQTVWYHTDPIPQLGASLIFMNLGMQSMMHTEDENVTRFQQIFGAYLDWHPKDFRAQASYYRQTGFDEYSLKIQAWMASAELDWDINKHWHLTGGYFYMSGDENYFVPPAGAIGMARKTEVHGFNPLFGSHHQFYGAMDFFYVKTFYGGNTPGLQDGHIGGTWKPIDAVSVQAKYHLLATGIRIENASSILGHEVEVNASWKVHQDVTLLAGYTFMHGTDTMIKLKQGSQQNQLHWAWLMLVATPNFFKTRF